MPALQPDCAECSAAAVAHPSSEAERFSQTRRRRSYHQSDRDLVAPAAQVVLDVDSWACAKRLFVFTFASLRVVYVVRLSRVPPPQIAARCAVIKCGGRRADAADETDVHCTRAGGRPAAREAARTPRAAAARSVVAWRRPELECRLPRIAWLLLSVAVLMRLANNVQNSGASQFSSSSSSGMVPPVGTPSPIDLSDSIRPVNKAACPNQMVGRVGRHPDKTLARQLSNTRLRNKSSAGRQARGL